MFSIQSPSSTSTKKVTPHLLPARIHHNGPIPSTSTHFQPQQDSNGTSHVYFRGRHLHGTSVPLPENYTGAVLHMTDKTLAVTQSRQEGAEEDDDMDDGPEPEVKIAEQMGEFDQFVVWEHGAQVDGKEDAYVRAVEEWIEFAEAMHCEEDDEMEEQRPEENKS